ncbi:MAG: glycosyltransferase [Candidatus Omnitrophica bacterium]|nr:glycosyltransferase [Candidatus Omnitrophota bacterium]
MKFTFWFSVILIFYTYIGYAVILKIIVKSKRLLRSARNDERTISDDLPTVSFIITARNEEGVIRKKLEDTLTLDYPKDKLEVIVASDASSDDTNRIVEEFEGVKLVRQDEHKGKTAVQNLAVSQASGDILVFSDATTIYKKEAIRKLVRNFGDPNVGCVGGEEHFKRQVDGEWFTVNGKGIEEEASFFWKYEKYLRRRESEINSMIGVSGCIFAIRRELYEPLEESLIEDFALPLIVNSRGFKVVCEEEAICYENAAKDTGTEFSRKTRIVTGGINVLYKMKHLLNPIKYPLLSFQLFSHKILRWLSPLFLLGVFVSNLYLFEINRFYYLSYIAQLCFYGIALFGHITRAQEHTSTGAHLKIVRLIYHFCVMNFAAVLGFIRFLRGERRVVWQPVR